MRQYNSCLTHLHIHHLEHLQKMANINYNKLEIKRYKHKKKQKQNAI